MAENPSRRAASTVTLTVVLAGGLYAAQTARNSPNAQLGHGSVPQESGVAIATDGRAPDEPGHSRTEPNEMLTKIQAAGAAVVAATMVSAAQAQQAVQWRTQDGGNGHWYLAGPGSLTWSQARQHAQSRGGHLATVQNAMENAFIVAHLRSAINLNAWLGGYRTSDPCSPNCTWRWVDDSPWVFTNWNQGEPNDPVNEDSLEMLIASEGRWNDLPGWVHNAWPVAMIEWDADCNGDGVVDYGQIRDGTLADSNTNNIPDCCEHSVPCTDCYRYDLNPTGTVDGADLGALVAFWGPVSAAFPRADINRDGIVNGEDLGLLLANWGPCS